MVWAYNIFLLCMIAFFGWSLVFTMPPDLRVQAAEYAGVSVDDTIDALKALRKSPAKDDKNRIQRETSDELATKKASEDWKLAMEEVSSVSSELSGITSMLSDMANLVLDQGSGIGSHINEVTSFCEIIEEMVVDASVALDEGEEAHNVLMEDIEAVAIKTAEAGKTVGEVQAWFHAS